MSYSIDPLTGSSTASNANWIVSLADVFEQQKDDSSATASVSAYYSNCISRVSDYIEFRRNKPVANQTYYGLYDGDGCDELELRNYPITSITSLKYRSNPTTSWTDIITSGSISANCLLYSYKIKLYNYSFPCGCQNIQVVYSAGYQIIPDHWKKIALDMISIAIKESKQGSSNSILGIQSVNEGGATNKNVTYLDLTEKWDKIIDIDSKILI